MMLYCRCGLILKEVVKMGNECLDHCQQHAIVNFEMNYEIVHALADYNRQKIIILLARHLSDGLTVNSMTQQMSITQPAVSHHLRILRKSGIVAFRKIGLQSFYYLTLKEPFKKLENALREFRVSFEN